MSHRTVVLALLAVVVVLLSSMTVLPGRAAPSSVLSLPVATTAPSLVTDERALPAGSHTAPLPGTYPVSLTFTLVSPHAAAFSSFLVALEDPASPNYRHFLTYPQYLQEYAPTPAEASTVAAALRAAGGSAIAQTPDRAGMSVVLPASAVDRLFGVTLEQYGSDGSVPLFTAVGTPTLSTSLRGTVAGVDGLSDVGAGSLVPSLSVSEVRPLTDLRSPGLFVHDNTSNSDWFVGSDYTQAYGATRLFPGGGVPNATYPIHVAIATLLASGYNESTGQDLPPWDPAVVQEYFNDTLPLAWPKPVLTGVPVTIGSVTPPAPGSFGALNDSSLDEFENSLDLEMAGSLAPGAPIYNFYFAGSLLTGTNSVSSIASDFAQSLSEALSYSYAPNHLGVVSGSFGLPDLNNTLWDYELGVAASTGVTVLMASGDQGNAPDSMTGRSDGPWPVWPATASYATSGAVSVGGASLTLGGSPTSDFNGSSLNLSYDPTVTGITNQSAWYDTTLGDGQVAGSEGGVSTTYPEPTWQYHSAAQPAIVNATVRQGVGSLGRTGPDVALAANDTIATVLANATGSIFFAVLEGTSVAAPLFAGLLADVIAVESARTASGWTSLGFLAPEIYRIASFYAANPGFSGDPLEDVRWGGNYFFSAGPGWDPVTGWGGVNASLLLSADENATVSNYFYSGPTPGLPPVPPPTGTPFPWTTFYVVVGVVVAAAVVLVALLVRRPTGARGPGGVPPGAQGFGGSPFGPGVQGGIYPGATFLCPYCGTVRPAEPVRCPRCGAL